MNFERKWITLENGVKVFLDNQAICKGCGQAIIWAATETNKKMPINPDGNKAHWATCPQAQKFKSFGIKPKDLTGGETSGMAARMKAEGQK